MHFNHFEKVFAENTAAIITTFFCYSAIETWTEDLTISKNI